jgi:hypothetical protein
MNTIAIYPTRETETEKKCERHRCNNMYTHTPISSRCGKSVARPCVGKKCVPHHRLNMAIEITRFNRAMDLFIYQDRFSPLLLLLLFFTGAEWHAQCIVCPISKSSMEAVFLSLVFVFLSMLCVETRISSVVSFRCLLFTRRTSSIAVSCSGNYGLTVP